MVLVIIQEMIDKRWHCVFVVVSVTKCNMFSLTTIGLITIMRFCT